MPLPKIVKRNGDEIKEKADEPVVRHGSIIRQQHTKARSNLVCNNHPEILKLKDSGIGRKMIIVASGPSVKRANLEIVNELPNVDCLTVNRPDERVWPTKYWHFNDSPIWMKYKLFDNPKTQIIVSQSCRLSNAIVLKHYPEGFGFSYDLAKGVVINKSSTYSALQIAAYMNYDRIVVLGCDQGLDHDGALYHNRHDFEFGGQEKRVDKFDFEAKRFEQLLNYDMSKFIFASDINQRNWFNKLGGTKNLNLWELL